MNHATDAAEKFIEKNLSPEKIKKTTENVKEAIRNAADKTNDFVQHNLNSEKIEKAAIEGKEEIKVTADDAKEDVKSSNKVAQHMHHLKYSRITTILINFEETLMTAYVNAIAHTLPLEHSTLTNCANNAKSNIINFIENYPGVIEYLQSIKSDDTFYLPFNISSITKPEIFEVSDSAYNDMCDNYSLFITSCMYLTILQDISLHGKSDCINSMGKKYYMLNQLADLMELQSSAINKKTTCTNN